MPDDQAGEATKRGRPSVHPGEGSVELRVTVEISLHRRLRNIAQQEREELPDTLRQALRQFAAKKLRPPTP